MRPGRLGLACGVALAALAACAARAGEGDGASAPAALPPVPRAGMPFVIYAEVDDPFRPYSSTGWMGNLYAIHIDEAWLERPHRGRTCIRLGYTDTYGWGGIAWLNPDNNWGESPGGYDLGQARKVTFYARGEHGSEIVEFKVGVRQEPHMPYRDTARLATGKVKLRSSWTKYVIPLRGADLSRVISAFVWVVDAADKPITFYLDDIQYE
jgi:hypothetical protein